MAVTKYSFDLMKNYPTDRRYIIRKPLKTTLMDSIKELIIGKK